MNAYHESWPPWYLDRLDYSDKLNHSDNPDWSMINQKDNRRIRIVYLVLFILSFAVEFSYVPNKNWLFSKPEQILVMVKLQMHYFERLFL